MENIKNTKTVLSIFLALIVSMVISTAFASGDVFVYDGEDPAGNSEANVNLHESLNSFLAMLLVL